MGDWKTAKLRDVGVRLIDCAHKTPDAQTTGYPYVSIPQMKNGRIDFSTARLIATEDYLEWTKKAKHQRDDVILSRRTNPGVTASDYTGTEFALGQNLVLLRADGKQIYPPFLKWMTQSTYWWEQIAKYNNVGAIFDSLKCADVPNFELPIPPIDVQKSISSLLSALDDKIELNRIMNETLEVAARALFTNWFVDFGPTRAKMDRQSSYLAPDIWALFPAALDEDGKPEGWSKKPLSELFEIIGGGTPKTSVGDYWGGDIPWFSVGDRSSDGSSFVHDTEKQITIKGVEESSVRLVAPGTTIISARGTVGNIAIAVKEMSFNQSCYALKGKGSVGDWQVYLTAQHMVSQLQALAHGSVFSTITRQTFDAIPLFVPNDEINQAFDKTVAHLFERQKLNGSESVTLNSTLDLLLPKLMAGEIKFKDAEKQIGEVI
jgi:type I restriction enzyme S subunit